MENKNTQQEQNTAEKIILTFLEKLETLSERERLALTEYIELKNKPIFTTSSEHFTRII